MPGLSPVLGVEGAAGLLGLLSTLETGQLSNFEGLVVLNTSLQVVQHKLQDRGIMFWAASVRRFILSLTALVFMQSLIALVKLEPNTGCLQGAPSAS